MTDQEMVLRVFAIVFSVIGITLVIYGILAYVFQAIGLYSISRRRGLRVSGFAWVPILRDFKFGQIADDAIFHKSGKKTHYMVLYPVFYLAGWVLVNVGGFVMVFSRMTQGMIIAIQRGDLERLEQMIERIIMGPQFVVGVVIGTIGYLLILVAAVFQYICFYHIYKSCSRKWIAMFVLTFVFPFLYPFFIFAIRKNDNPDWYHKDPGQGPDIDINENLGGNTFDNAGAI